MRSWLPAAIVISCGPGTVELSVPGRVCRRRIGRRDEDTTPLLLGLPFFPTEMVSDGIWMSEVVSRLIPTTAGPLVTRLAPLVMEKLTGNQIEHKLFGFLANQLHRNFF
jgi:hypothetical protein